MPTIVILRGDRPGAKMLLDGPNTFNAYSDGGIFVIEGDTRIDLPGAKELLMIVSDDRTEIYTDQEARDKLEKSE
jgi:hypothetical protein